MPDQQLDANAIIDNLAAKIGEQAKVIAVLEAQLTAKGGDDE